MVASKWRFEAFAVEEVDAELERLERLDARPTPGRVRRRVYTPRYQKHDEVWETAAPPPQWRPPPEPLVFFGPVPPPSPEWLLTPHERLRLAGGR